MTSENQDDEKILEDAKVERFHVLRDAGLICVCTGGYMVWSSDGARVDSVFDRNMEDEARAVQEQIARARVGVSSWHGFEVDEDTSIAAGHWGEDVIPVEGQRLIDAYLASKQKNNRVTTPADHDPRLPHYGSSFVGIEAENGSIYRVTRTLVYEGSHSAISRTLERGAVPANGAAGIGGGSQMRITSTTSDFELVSPKAEAIRRLHDEAAALGYELVLDQSRIKRGH